MWKRLGEKGSVVGVVGVAGVVVVDVVVRFVQRVRGTKFSRRNKLILDWVGLLAS